MGMTRMRLRGRMWMVVFVSAAIIAGCVATALALTSLIDALVLKGLPDPGMLTNLGLPFVQAVGLTAGTVATGCNLGAACLVAPQTNGVLDAAGYRFVRMAAWTSALWALCAAAMVPLTLSDVSGQRLLSFTDPLMVWNLAGLIDAANGWRWTALLAAAASCGGFVALRWSVTPALLALSLATVIPLGLTGHSSSGGSHDVASSSLLVHLLATTLWAGGLLALLALAATRAGDSALAVRRFSAIATVCAAATILTGVINAWVRADPRAWLESEYGRLVIVKTAAFIVLMTLGWLHRRRSMPALARGGRRRPFIRIGLAETAVFAATIGIGVGLGRTPPPPPDEFAGEPTATEAALGYDLAGPPTPWVLLTDWRIDVIFVLLAIWAVTAYLVGVWRLHRLGRAWPRRRTVAWLTGWTVAVLATSSGIGRYMPAVFSVHMAANMLLSVLVPPLLVGGSPVVLTMEARERAASGKLSVALTSMARFGKTRQLQFVRRPEVAGAIFLGGFAMAYLSGVFDVLVSGHAGHVAFNLGMFAIGCYFWWCMLTGPLRERQRRLRSMLIALTGMVAFGITLLIWPVVLGEKRYRSLQLAWGPDLAADQRTAGGIVAAACAAMLLTVLAGLWAMRRSNGRRDNRAEMGDGHLR